MFRPRKLATSERTDIATNLVLGKSQSSGQQLRATIKLNAFIWYRGMLRWVVVTNNKEVEKIDNIPNYSTIREHHDSSRPVQPVA